MLLLHSCFPKKWGILSFQGWDCGSQRLGFLLSPSLVVLVHCVLVIEPWFPIAVIYVIANGHRKTPWCNSILSCLASHGFTLICMNSLAVVTKTDLIVVTLVPFLLLQRSPFLFHLDVFTRTVPIWTLTSGWLLPYDHCSLSSRTRSLFLQSPALYWTGVDWLPMPSYWAEL